MTITAQSAAQVVRPDARNREAAATLLRDFPEGGAVGVEYLAVIIAMSEHWGRLDAIAELQRRAEAGANGGSPWSESVACALTDMKEAYR